MRDPTTRWGDRAREIVRPGYRRLRLYFIVAVQAGLAATLAWTTAALVLHNPDPTFAPAAAVAVVATAVGHRARRAIELVAGVLLGIVVGDLLIIVAGTGAWQTGVIVFLAITVAVVFRGGGALVTQAGGTAVLIATLTPASPDLELPRTVNALVGALVGVLVALVVIPLNPLRTVRRVAEPGLETFAREVTASAEALARGDPRAAEDVLNRMRGAEAELNRLREIVAAAYEVVRFSPVRWSQRRRLAAYRRGAQHMDRAFRNSRAMVRRIGAALREAEPVPADLPAAVAHIGEAVRLLHQDFLAAREPTQARERILRAVREAGSACRQEIGFSGTIVVSQVRTVANDLLRATGLPRDEARRLVRRAAAGR